MNAVISVLSSILVGILRSIGWKVLILQVLEDLSYWAAKKFGPEILQQIATRVGDALKEVEKKEP